MIFKVRKDGGPLSRVTGYFLCEFKKLLSVVLLKFDDGSREAFHDHAFGALSWVLKGKLVEQTLEGKINEYTPTFIPIRTPRSMFHKVTSQGTTWVLTFRGPWSDRWREFLPHEERFVTLTHGRKEVRAGT